MEKVLRKGRRRKINFSCSEKVNRGTLGTIKIISVEFTANYSCNFQKNILFAVDNLENRML